MMKALLTNFAYSRRTEAIFTKGQEALIHLGDESKRLVAQLADANVPLGKTTKTVALATNSLEKVEGYKKTHDEEVAKLWEKLLKESSPVSRHGRPSSKSAESIRRTFNPRRMLSN